MIGRNNSSLIGLLCMGKIIMIVFLTVSSCQRQVSCHKDGIEIIDVLNKDCPIQIDLYDIVDSIKYIPLETSRDAEGMKKLFKQFSFPGGISSHSP